MCYLCYNDVKGQYVMSTTDHMIFLVYCRFINLYIDITDSQSSINHLFTVYSQCFLYAFHELVLWNLFSVFTILTIIMKRYAMVVGKKLMTWYKYRKRFDKIDKLTIKNLIY